MRIDESLVINPFPGVDDGKQIKFTLQHAQDMLQLFIESGRIHFAERRSLGHQDQRRGDSVATAIAEKIAQCLEFDGRNASVLELRAKAVQNADALLGGLAGRQRGSPRSKSITIDAMGSHVVRYAVDTPID